MSVVMDKIAGLLTLLICISNTKQFDLESCRYPIGIESGKILDSAFSSSSHASVRTSASRARIRSETDGWCPLNKISSTTDEYIQIDLVNLTVITLIELQGRFSLKPNEHFADAFRLEYRRDKRQKWIKYKDFSGQYILSGNSNSYIPTIRDILPSIIARQIRIIPIVTGSISKYICMRLELYGCSYQDGLISYSIPQGDKRGYNMQFIDEIYDGQNENGILKDGLGQLIDGILAQDDYRLPDHHQIGYDWIGWKRKSTINLVFYFDTFRNFTSISLHTSNFFPHDISLFDSITIATCEKFNHHQQDFLIPNDSQNSSARWIEISFADKKGFLSNCLNVTLTTNNRSQWILISEIQFDSIPIYPNREILIIHYWHWLLFAFILLIILLIFFYISWIQTSHPSLSLKNPLKLEIPRIDCWNRNPSYISSISKNDLHHHLIISTTNSIHSSDFSSTTMSTINPYLTAISNHTTNLTTNPYSSVDIYIDSLWKNIQGPCGNSTYECLLPLKDSQLMMRPCWKDEQLIVGQVYSTMNGCSGTIFRGYLYLRHPHDILKPILIKTLITNDPTQKKLFDKEHELLNHLYHPNLVQFYGYTMNQNYALIEHSDLGDLYTNLSTSQNISINLRLHMLVQLSNALRYLESHHIIHRDIAARNCLIYPNYEIKLTNSALASPQFQSHYYQINHLRLPIRWMAPESMSNNEFTMQSDIWSFGITLWEIMTNCSTLPYGLLNDEEVHQRLKLAEGLHLSKPECLSKELIDLMLECWRPCNERPTFDEIYMFFNQRLDGMDVI